MSAAGRGLAAACAAWVLCGVNVAAARGGADGGGDALAARLRAIEAAVRTGDAEALAGAATRAGRVRLHLPDARGSYGAGQLQVVLARVFDTFETRSFTFDDGAGARSGATTALAPGTWVRTRRDGHGQERDTLTFALRLERDDWRIVEIRSSP